MTQSLLKLAVERLGAELATRLGVSRQVWRLGHVNDPLDFVPRAFCSWEHRFDDPDKNYRTLYCAEDPTTCLREVLADLRPNTKTRADFEQFQLDQGVAPSLIQRPAAEVSVSWREAHALAPARVSRSGPLPNLNDRNLLERLADTHAALLTSYGMPQLDLSQITSKTRPVTQAISRDLFERGAAGLIFRSNQDSRHCIVLFEGRARLEPAGRAVPMSENHPALLRVCSEYGLILRQAVPPASPQPVWRP